MSENNNKNKNKKSVGVNKGGPMGFKCVIQIQWDVLNTNKTL